MAISCYPCQDTIIENNIAEDWDRGYDIQCKFSCGNNKYYGNIALNSGGFGFTARSNNQRNVADQMPTNTVLVNNVAYHSDNWSVFGCRTCKNTQMTNNSAIANVAPQAYVGVFWDLSCGTACGEAGDGVATNFATNTLLVDVGAAFMVTNVTTWAVDYVLSYGNIASTPALSNAHYTHVSTADPGLGSCIVFLPSTSPAKGAGAGGADIGANILYRYQDGELTTTPLWDPTTGRFPCGAQVTGVNDIAGSSCFDVHKRLNVNTNGCTLPLAASPGPTLRVLGVQP